MGLAQNNLGVSFFSSFFPRVVLLPHLLRKPFRAPFRDVTPFTVVSCKDLKNALRNLMAVCFLNCAQLQWLYHPPTQQTPCPEKSGVVCPEKHPPHSPCRKWGTLNRWVPRVSERVDAQTPPKWDASLDPTVPPPIPPPFSLPRSGPRWRFQLLRGASSFTRWGAPGCLPFLIAAFGQATGTCQFANISGVVLSALLTAAYEPVGERALVQNNL